MVNYDDAFVEHGCDRAGNGVDVHGTLCDDGEKSKEFEQFDGQQASPVG